MKSFRSKFAAMIFMMFLTLPRFVTSTMQCVPISNGCTVFSYEETNEKCEDVCQQKSKIFRERAYALEPCSKNNCELVCMNCHQIVKQSRLIV